METQEQEINRAEQSAINYAAHIKALLKRYHKLFDYASTAEEIETKREEIPETDQEEIETEIYEMPLGVCVKSGWAMVGDKLEAEEYEILLCTGGPAVRITGNLGKYNECDQ